jgi:hypothetical protein
MDIHGVFNMKGHEEFLEILANYRDATAEERVRADEHVEDCPNCAASFAAYRDVDAALERLPQPPLPAQLRQPLPAVLAGRGRGRSPFGATLGFRFAGSLAPAAVVLVVLVTLSVIMLSVDAGRTPVTSTPTLTTTLTPTTIVAQQTAPAALGGIISAAAFAPLVGPDLAPTPAPVPVPGAARSAVLFAGHTADATMTH